MLKLPLKNLLMLVALDYYSGVVLLLGVASQRQRMPRGKLEANTSHLEKQPTDLQPNVTRYTRDICETVH